jgi:hypothetical protein
LAFPEEYFIRVEEEQKGPYTFPQLKRLYEKALIPAETLYWQDGMEEWLAVADLCGARSRKRLQRLKQLRVAGIALVSAAALLTAWCGPVLKNGWKEMNDHDFTQEGAYWKARGFVREEVKQQEASVAFDPYQAASVALTGTAATVILPGTLFARDGSGSKMTWKVALLYDASRKEWLLPGS